MVTEEGSVEPKRARLRDIQRSASGEAGLRGIVNVLSFRDDDSGRTPLAYAVALNLYSTASELIEMGADVNLKMGIATALTLAVRNTKLDGTEMVRLLLSKGADPGQLAAAGIDESSEEFEEQLNVTMRHWLAVARQVGTQSDKTKAHLKKLHPMDRMHELHYSIVGEEAAVALLKRSLAARFGNPAAQNKPLVVMLSGPPGHGKTYITRNLAASLVGEENVLEVACGALRDDADLFGARLGGSNDGSYSSDGRLTAFLRARQQRNNVVFLDEFEKIKELTSALGWDQSKKMYQAFLEPWQEGFLTDVGSQAGRGNAPQRIDVHRTVWILTSNWGQEEIVNFARANRQRVYGAITEGDVDWLKKELVQKKLEPLLLREFKGVHRELQALARRIDLVVPFLPFTEQQQVVVADTALRQVLSVYREPCVLAGDDDKRRLLGNTKLRHTRSLTEHAATFYDEMQGASSMCGVARDANGLFLTKFSEEKLAIPERQIDLMKSDQPLPPGEQPVEMWLHFDKEDGRLTLWEGTPPPAPRETPATPVVTDGEALPATALSPAGSSSGSAPRAVNPF